MLQKLIAFFTGNKTVDTVIGGFNKMLAELQYLEQHHSDKSKEHTIEIAVATAAREAAEKEAARAAEISTRIATMVGATLKQEKEPGGLLSA